MSAQARLADYEQMTVEEFLGFCDARPHGERWELIDGIAIMNPSPTDWHQTIVLNIAMALHEAKTEAAAKWTPLLGIGTRVPIAPTSLPQPDLIVMEGRTTGTAATSDALVVFEVLSKSNTKSDQAWRRRAYASIPNCQHYVTVSTKHAECVRYDRDAAWTGTTVTGLRKSLTLPALGVTIPLSHVYRTTPIK